MNLNEEDLIPVYFRISTYEETYQSIIYPTNGDQLWDVTEFHNILPPSKRIILGRLKKKRELEAWELKKNEKHVAYVTTYGLQKKM